MSVAVLAGLSRIRSHADTAGAFTPGFLTHRRDIRGIAAINVALAQEWFNTPATFVMGFASGSHDPRPAGYRKAVPVLKYNSAAQFASDVGAGRITFGYRWVQYDPESWAKTPLAEQQDPVGAITQFAGMAHTNGFQVLLSPGRDLAPVAYPGSPLAQQPGESCDHWYIRVLTPAAINADVWLYQDQRHEADVAKYRAWYGKVRAAVQTAHPGIPVWSGVSCIRGDAQQMAAAAQSIPAAEGFWLNVGKEFAQAEQFLALM
jgi:hypothetical protein